MKTLQIGQIVYTNQQGEGIILSIDGIKAIVDFNGTSKVMLLMLLKDVPIASKTKNYMKVEVEVKETFNSIVANLEGNSRGSMFGFADIYSQLEKLAFTQNHSAGSIIEDARNRKNITKKQAQVVAFFAQKNNII